MKYSQEQIISFSDIQIHYLEKIKVLHKKSVFPIYTGINNTDVKRVTPDRVL